jgi:uncharacterized membrane protein (DUF2068 family)
MNADMKRSPLISIVNLLQLLLGLMLAGLSIYLVALTRSPKTLADPDPAGTVHRLLIGAAVLGAPALITLIGALGLWKRRFWGWVLSLATDVGTLTVLVYSMIDERDWEGDEISWAAGCMLLIILLLLPAVRKFYWSAAVTTTSLSS